MIHIITPSLAYGRSQTRLFTSVDQPDQAFALIEAGGRALVPDKETACATLHLIRGEDADVESLIDNALLADPEESVF